ncbi:class I SAM-dependent methyltransferase [Brevibacillus sp. WF146]|jgi:MMP 1-O-methyltransferase|uniref:class I SAM-dependent methyltransferase n=1 Tax=Brevibacillus sp. WF146 TaxID=319501 RepID=UPI0007EDDB26|nr:class I SAM-dependent methyltransferase [Brevibacillus sp. WF146]UYZ12479.1 class I SAM-dependent methyltransferase [Brevibacillus sp. WF146]
MSGHFFLQSPTLHTRLLEIQAKVAPIQGWVSDQAGMVLYQLTRFYAPTGTVVELGSWKGRSTVWLAHAVKDRGAGRVFAVDTWKGTQNGGPDEQTCQAYLKGYQENQLFEEFLQNLANAGVAECVQPLKGDTSAASWHFPRKHPIGLLFIDADHNYEAVKRDFSSWSPMVPAGGYVVFDDVPSWPGPTRLASELPASYRRIYMGWNICVFQKLQG